MQEKGKEKKNCAEQKEQKRTVGGPAVMSDLSDLLRRLPTKRGMKGDGGGAA